MKRNEMLTEICLKEDTQTNIAKKYNVSEAYVSQINARFALIKYSPKIKEHKLICFQCEIADKKLLFHFESHVCIALLCESCNRNFVDNKINTNEYKDLLSKLYKIMINKMNPNAKLNESEQKTIKKIEEVLEFA